MYEQGLYLALVLEGEVGRVVVRDDLGALEAEHGVGHGALIQNGDEGRGV